MVIIVVIILIMNNSESDRLGKIMAVATVITVNKNFNKAHDNRIMLLTLGKGNSENDAIISLLLSIIILL